MEMAPTRASSVVRSQQGLGLTSSVEGYPVKGSAVGNGPVREEAGPCLQP